MTMPPAVRQYLRRFFTVMTVYVLSVIGVNLISRDAWPIGIRAGLAVFPVLPAIVMVWVIADFVRKIDEVQRAVITESCLWGLITVGLASFTYGFLEGTLSLPRLSYIWIFPALIASSGLAQIFVRHRYL